MQRSPNRPRPAGRAAAHALRLMLVMMLALTAFSVIPGTTALAATGQMYLGSATAPGSTRATDPHGNIWLAGTIDGTTTGAMDPGTDPTSAGYGHLWTTDVPSGFCRIIPAVTDGTGAVVQQAIIDRNTPGGCITAGGKAGGPALDPRRNADGTFYLYTPDWAVRSAGVYRLTYDPGAQTMKGTAELLAPNRYPFDNKPFDVQLGADNRLYVANDKDSNIARISGVNGPLSAQTVETSIAKSTDGKRVRAITFACWSNTAILNGGAGFNRTGPGCSPADPAPDLVLAQFNTITVVLNAETCQTAPGGCTTVSTPIKVLTPMGLRTDPKDSTVIYISDSPGATATIKRYTIGTDVQDTYATYGVMEDGSLSQFSFTFSVGFGPDRSMYIGDDPTAGATAFNGRYFRTAPNAPPSVAGAPGAPAAAEIAPTPHNGTMFGGAFTGVPPSTTAIGPPSVAYSPLTLDANGIWMGSHLWLPDATGMCRMDVPPGQPAPPAGPPLAFLNASTCMLGTNAAGLSKPEQSAFDAAHNFLYVADGGSKSVGVVRFTFDPTGTVCTNPDTTKVGVAEILCSSTDSVRANQPQVMAPAVTGTGQGLDGQRADAVALDTTNDLLYVGFRARNLTAATQIARLNHASAADTATQTVDFISKTTRSSPAFGMGLIANADGTKDLYISNGKGVDVLFNVNACPPGACVDINLLNVRAPKGFATDGKDMLYMAGPPAPGTGSSTTLVQSYKISTGELLPFASVGINPDGLQQQFAFVFSLTLNPNTGDLYVTDNADAVAPPNGTGKVWLVAAGQNGPGQPVFTAKPGLFTNNKTPSFAFTSTPTPASFQCSLVLTGTSDSFNPCTSPFTPATPLTDGAYTFKVVAIDAAGVKSIPGIVSFTVDTVVPVVTISAAPTSPTNVNTPSFTFAATKNGAAATTGIAYQCSLSTGADAFAACGSPQNYAAQADGTYTFKVHATDVAGNVSADATSAVTIDTTAPTVTASPVGGQYPTAQSVTLTATDATAVKIYYTTDGSTPTTASTPYTAPIAINASTTLKYIAVDAANNQSAVGSQVYTIGTTAISTKPANPTASSNVSFSFVASATASCTLSQGATTLQTDAACVSPKAYSALADGTYTFTVSSSPTDTATASFTIDTTAPTIDSNPSNPSTSTTETFAFSKASAGTAWTFQCSLVVQGAADSFAPCASPKSYTGVANGTYTFKVQAVDAAKVVAPNVFASYAFTVQGTPPAVTPPASAPVQTLTTAVGQSSTTGVPVTLNWGTSPDAVGYEVQQQINGNVFAPVTICATAPCNVTTAVVKVKPDPINQSTVTTYRFQVRAINNAGAASAWVVAPSFSIAAQDNSTGFSFNGNFSGVNLTGAYGGSVSESSTVGATAQNSNASTMNAGTTAGSVAWISTKGPDRGVADVLLDGTKVATVDLYSPTTQLAQIVWVSPNNLTGPHTIQIKVDAVTAHTTIGTGSKVDVDAFLAVKQ